MNRHIILLILILKSVSIFGQDITKHGKNFKTDCKICHQTNDWKIANNQTNFNHDTTNFKLTGSHLKTSCKNCHQSLIFNEAKTSCNSCHIDIHNMTVGNDCSRCHTSQNWLVNNINELHEQNGFQLVGAHSATVCIDCHKNETNQKWERIGNECSSCHLKKFNETQNPNHIQSAFSTNCIDCHDPFSTTWGDGRFHYFFKLVDVHNITDCKKCHINDNYKSTSSECISCHEVDFNNTNNPKHSAAGFGTNCSTCHSTKNGWVPSTWGGGNSHNFFPLTEGHQINDCIKCHDPNDYSSAKSVCISCHQTDYNNTTNPKHSSPSFGNNCNECHSTKPGWKPAINNFHTTFPLTGSHSISDCSKCHDINDYSKISVECVSCHQADYNNAANPKHTTPAFSTNCTLCHSTSPGWKPVSGNFHNMFSLTESHNITDCLKCHDPNDYSKASSECVSCHQTDYNNTTNPVHSSSGFGTNCSICHTTKPDWKPATMLNHDAIFFPIYSGEHNGEWTSCVSCHLTPSDYSQFSCINCHEHNNSSSLAKDHKDVSNYVYQSSACYSCHPKGKS